MRTWKSNVDLARRLVDARRDLPSPYARFRRILGPEQMAVVDDEHPLVAVCCGRRAGKTTAFIGKALKVFDREPRAAVFYFAPTGEQGVDILWEDLRLYNTTHGLGLVEHWSEKWWTLGGRKIEVFSFNDRQDVARARGRKSHLVGIDEGQLGPDWFATEIEQAVMPTTLDYRGQVLVMGTPAPVADGFFHDACHETNGSWSNDHHWTAAENPFFTGRDPLAEARQMYNLAEDGVTYQREWLGLWIVDPDALVYVIPPLAVVTGPGSYFKHVYGLDFGFRDKDAMARVDIDALRQRAHLGWIAEWDGHQTNHRLFERILEQQARFPGPVVFDPAGHTTKKTIETFRSDAPQVQWVMAEKARKVEFIQILNDDMRAGRATVEPGSPMIKEARRLRWKRPGKVAEDADHSDLGDAWLYPARYARDMLRALPKKAPRPELDPFDEVMRKRAEAAQQETRDGYFANRLRDLG